MVTDFDNVRSIIQGILKLKMVQYKLGRNIRSRFKYRRTGIPSGYVNLKINKEC